jgi:hypothetical protein
LHNNGKGHEALKDVGLVIVVTLPIFGLENEDGF